MKFIACLAVTAAATALRVGVTHASGPVAAFALVDKVTFEPNAEKPERIQITGVFCLVDPGSYAYRDPQRGYLYVMLSKRNQDLAHREWGDLKAVAGTRQVVAFGLGWMSKMRLRKPGERAESPDEYSMGNGVAKVNPSHPQAKALLNYKDQ